MRVAYLSDIHIDMNGGVPFKLDPHTYISHGVDVIVIAGDVSNSAAMTRDFLEDFLDELNGQCDKIDINPIEVIFVPGNHEYYRQPIEIADQMFREVDIKYENFHYLYAGKRPLILQTEYQRPVAFVGDTLWTDFNLYGKDTAYNSMNDSGLGMSDYRYIWTDFYGGTRFTPELSRMHHIESVFALEGMVETLRMQDADMPIVIVSHHAPSMGSIAEEYATGPWAKLNGAYATRLLDIGSDSYSAILAENANFWFHGHMHNVFNYVAGNVRVLTNPRGYTMKCGENENADFRYLRFVDI